jgi:hypothetical protein
MAAIQARSSETEQPGRSRHPDSNQEKALAHIARLPRVTVAMRNGDDAAGREVVAEVLSREPRRAADSGVRDLVEVAVTQSAVLPMCSPNQAAPERQPRKS